MTSKAEASTAQIKDAARCLIQGGLVVLPTETVYGLGADAENPLAVSLIYTTKNRPANHPIIIHVTPEATLSYWATDIPPQAYALINAFWPGPLTLILKRVPQRATRVSGGQNTIGLRCPAHPVAQRLLQAFVKLKPNGQGGIAAPSANRFGQVSPTQVEHVYTAFAPEIAAGMPVLEGGAATIGIESTILDLSRVQEGIGPVLLRPGHIRRSDIAAVLGVMPAMPDTAAPRTSGRLKAHYAPHTPLLLVSHAQLMAIATQKAPLTESAWTPASFKETSLIEMPLATELSPPPSQRVVIAYTPPPESLPPNLVWQRIAAEPAHYAQSLYTLLHQLDAQHYQQILVEAPPHTAKWEAVNDRLHRAAAAFTEN